MSTSATQRIRILVIDDQPVVLAAIRIIIKSHSVMQSHSGMTLVGEAGNRQEGLAAAARERPDVILLDLDLGDDNGLDFLPELREAAPQAQVLILTGTHDAELHRRAVKLGAMGVVLKEKGSQVLTAAILSAHAGEIWIDRSLMASLLEDEPAG